MDGVGAVSARAAKRARKAAREAEEAKAESERAQEIEQIKAEAMKELQAENDRLKTHNGELEAKIEQLKAENEQLKKGCGRRGVPHTPVPGAPVQRPRLLGDLELMNLLDKSFVPTWVMKGAASCERRWYQPVQAQNEMKPLGA